MRYMLVLIVALTLVTGFVPAEDHPRKPNLMVILVDDLGYADLHCYGSSKIRSPHLDRLAKEGVRLTDCYAAAPVCSPTRAALITGRYPQRVGFDWVIDYTEKDRGLSTNDGYLPKLLSKAGYATGLFGKWHLGYKPEFSPNAHGFDEFFGFLAADLDYYSHKDANGDPGLYENTKLIEEKGYLTDLITEHSSASCSTNSIGSGSPTTRLWSSLTIMAVNGSRITVRSSTAASSEGIHIFNVKSGDLIRSLGLSEKAREEAVLSGSCVQRAALAIPGSGPAR